MIKRDCEDRGLGKLFPYLLICFCVLLVYLPSFTGEFILDDKLLIQDNPYIRQWHSIGSYLGQEDGYDKESDGHTGYYRPLINLSYTLDYKIWGMSGPGFRITNIILHLLVCFTIFALYGLFLRNRTISLLLVLVFALHPINSEAVAWISSRNNLLATLFGVISFHCYIQAYRQQKYIYYVGSIVSFTLAVFSKEFGLMLVPIFFLYQRILNTRKPSIVSELREYLPYIIIGLFYFMLRQNVTGSLLTPSSFSEILIRIYYIPYVLFFNLKLIFLPYNLQCYIMKYPESILNVGALVSIFLFLVTVYLIWEFRKNSVLLFSVLAFFIAIFPVSGVVPTASPTIISMRWLYFPFPFILIVLSQPFERLIQRKRQMALALCACLALYLSVNSYILNRLLWHSTDTFFEQEVLHFDSAYYADGLAKIYFNEEKYELSERFLKKSFEPGGRKQAANYLLYAHLMFKKGEIDKAILYQAKASKYYMNKTVLGQFYHNEGMIALRSSDLDGAVKNFEKALLFSREDALHWENFGLAYGMTGDHEMAVNYLEEGIKRGAVSKKIKKNLAVAYTQSNDCQKAVSLLERMKYNADEKDLIWINKQLFDAKKCNDGED